MSFSRIIAIECHEESVVIERKRLAEARDKRQAEGFIKKYDNLI